MQITKEPPQAPAVPATALAAAASNKNVAAQPDKGLNKMLGDAKNMNTAAAASSVEIGRAHVNSSHTVISYAVFCLKKKTYSNSLTA